MSRRGFWADERTKAMNISTNVIIDNMPELTHHWGIREEDQDLHNPLNLMNPLTIPINPRELPHLFFELKDSHFLYNSFKMVINPANVPFDKLDIHYDDFVDTIKNAISDNVVFRDHNDALKALAYVTYTVDLKGKIRPLRDLKNVEFYWCNIKQARKIDHTWKGTMRYPISQTTKKTTTTMVVNTVIPLYNIYISNVKSRNVRRDV